MSRNGKLLMTGVLGGALPNRPGFNNFKGSNLSRWIAAQAAVAAGSAHTRVVCYGDSTTAGIQSDATSSGLWSQAYPNVLATNMTSRGVPASNESFFGNQNLAAGYAHYNPRQALGTGWATTAGNSLGGLRWFQNSSTSGAIATTPLVAVDSVDLYAINGFGSTFKINFAGGADTLVTSAGGSQVITPAYTVTGPLATQAVNIKWDGVGGGGILAGAIFYNSAVKEVHVINAGIGSASAAVMKVTTSAFSTLNALASIAPSLTIINLGINDMIGGTSLATSQADLTTIINTALISGDVILMGPNPFNTSLGGNTDAAFQISYAAMLKALAYSLNVPFVDQFTLMGGTLAAAQALGYISSDFTHPSQAGYAATAGWLSTVTAPGYRAH